MNNIQARRGNGEKIVIQISFVFIICFLVLSFLSYMTLMSEPLSANASVLSSNLSLLICFLSFMISVLLFGKFRNDEKRVFIIGITVFSFSVIHQIVGISAFNYSIIPLVGPLFSYSLVKYGFRKKYLKEKKFLNTIVFLFCLSIISIFYYRHVFPYSRYGGRFLMIYYVIFMLPLCLMMKKESFKFLSLGLVVTLSFLSLKRGAILSSSIVAITYCLYKIIPRDSKHNFVSFLFVIILAGFLYNYFESGNAEIDLAMERMMNAREDEGSGRIEIFQMLIKDISEFGFYDHLFGKGIKSTMSVNDGLTAHNDWIEMYYDFGFFVFSLWFFFYQHFDYFLLFYCFFGFYSESFSFYMYLQLYLS